MFGMDFKVVGAIARKDLRGYLGNPAGYVFLTLFIGVTGAAAFLQDAFFARNLADLALLNQVMPAILMVFVPAITMTAFADERKTGTEELLLTLPVRDVEVVLGKFLGALGMYTVALAFSLTHLLVLATLGAPDPGLMLSTYLGYWLMGSLFVAVGLLASLMTQNATVAFVLGVLGCSALVFAGAQAWAAGLLGVATFGGIGALAYTVAVRRRRGVGLAAGAGAALAAVLWVTNVAARSEDTPAFESVFKLLAVEPYFSAFGEGLIRLGDLAYFVGLEATLLYLCGFLLGRRHW